MTRDDKFPAHTRPLTREDRALWEKVARTLNVKFQRAPAKSPKPKIEPVAPKAATPKSAASRPIPPPIENLKGKSSLVQIAKAKKPPSALVDRRQKRRVLAGRIAIDARIDLHGMRQDEACEALLWFMKDSHRSGCKLLLVITGKGGGQDSPGQWGHDSERGILRRMVPLWLQSPAMLGLVSGMEEADRRHGGAGALYVRLKK